MNNDFEIESAAISDRGLNDSRPENEDSYLDLTDCGIFAVADGVGGAEAGEVASQMAVEILSEAFINISETADPEEVMRSALSKANESIFQMSSEIPQLSRMATTIAALHLRGDVATIGHVGDSRLYRMDRDQKLVQETDDHSIVADEVRAGRLTPEQASAHPSRNIISRALGAEPSVEVDLKTVMVEPGTSFLLCTDGVTRHVSDREIREILAAVDEPGSICGRLKDLCYERGAEDNLTAVVVRFGASELTGDRTDESYYPFDEEELTIASARPSENGDRVDTPAAIEDEPIKTAVEEVDRLSQNLIEPEQMRATVQHEEMVREPETEPVVPAPVNVQAVSTETGDRSFISERHREIFGDSVGYEKTSGLFGGVLRMLGMLLLGLFIGGLATYFWLGEKPPAAPAEVPVLNEMKSTNIPLTSFEESRRTVDRDPRRYIALNSNPQEAEDYFLLGRAYLLTGDYFLARNAFTTAKSRLSEVDARDARTISNEIEMALAVISSGSATEAFSRAVANTAEPGATVPAATPIR
jgi:protein phosphatase